MRHIVLVIAVAIAGCNKTGPEPAGARLAPATQPAAGSGLAPATAPSVSEHANRSALYLPAKFDDKVGSRWQGLVFTEMAGGSVNGQTSDGQTVSIKDGTIVDIKKMEFPVTINAPPSTADVAFDGKRVVIEGRSVMHEDRLDRSSDRRFAIFEAEETCRPFCHSTIYVVASDGRRKKISDDVFAFVVAWRGDGKEVAVGSICWRSSGHCAAWSSGQLWLVRLPDFTVNRLNGFTAPAYSPEGKLYLRDHDNSVFTYEQGTKPVRLSHGTRRTPDPAPVTFDDSGHPTFEPPTE